VGLLGNMAQQIFAVGTLIGPSVEIQQRRLGQLQHGFPDGLRCLQQLRTGESFGAEALVDVVVERLQCMTTV
jgi:hypothetical protein